MRFAYEEELESTCVEAGVHLQLNGTSRSPRPTDCSQRAAHVERGARRPGRVVLALVEQQQRVSAELEQPAASRVRHGEERGEGRVHHLGDLLRARFTPTGQALGHCREARDVDEREGSFDLQPGPLSAGAQPLERQARDERDEVGSRSCWRT